MQKIHTHEKLSERKNGAKRNHTQQRVNPSTEQNRQAAAAPDVNNITPDAILNVQAAYGNQFARRLVQQSPQTHKAAPQLITTYLSSSRQTNPHVVNGTSALIQREKTGLEKEVGKFVKGVEKVEGTIDGEEARKRLDVEINSYLTKHTVPRADIIAVAMPTSEIHGNFERKIWKIRLNQDLVNKTLTNQEYRELASTIFHEARHGEQFFSMARYIASQIEILKGINDPSRLAYMVRMAMQSDIPSDIALSAAQNRKMSKHKQEFARKMYESMYKPINEVVNVVSGQFPMGAKTEKPEFLGTYAKLHHAKQQFNEVEDFIRDYNLQRPISETDRLKRKQPTPLINAWKTRAPNYLNLYHDYLVELAYATTSVYRLAMKEYNNLGIEQDAFGVQELVDRKLGIHNESGQLVHITMPDPPDKVAKRTPDFEPDNFVGWVLTVDFDLQDTDKADQLLTTKNNKPLVVGDMINGRWKVTSQILNTLYGVRDTQFVAVVQPTQDYTGLNEEEDFMVMGNQCMTGLDLNVGDTLNGKWRVTEVLPKRGMNTYKVEKM